MSDTQLDIQQNEFQYPKEFEIAVSQIFVNVPLHVLKEKEYSAKVMRNADAIRLDISFHVKDDSGNIGEVSEKIFNFIQFTNAQKLDGVIFDNETGVLTFNNAGYVVAVLQEYIDQNPDELDGDMLNDLDETLMQAFKDHVPELVHPDNDEADFKYPSSLQAVVSGFVSYAVFKDFRKYFGLAFSEGQGTHQSLRIVCPNIEGENFPDPDLLEVLSEIYDELSIYKPEGVSVKMDPKTGQVVELDFPHPLKAFEMLKALYVENGMVGIEDVTSQWDDETLLEKLLAGNRDDVLPKNAEKQDPVNYKRMRKSVLSNYYRKMADAGRIETKDYNADDALAILPMGGYVSKKMIDISYAIASNANTHVSLQEIEGRIRSEMGLVTHPSQKHYRIH